MIAFDSNLLIYTLRLNPEFQAEARAIFYEIEQRGGICSSLVITESMHGEITGVDKIGVLASPSIEIISVTPDIAEQAGKIKIMHGLKTTDSIHLATALSAKAKSFVTNDKKLLRKTIPGLTIRGL